MHSAHFKLASPRQYVSMFFLSTSNRLLLSNDTPHHPAWSSVRVPVTVVKERWIRSMFSSCYDMSDNLSPFYPSPHSFYPLFSHLCIVLPPSTSLPCFPFLLYFLCFNPPLCIVLSAFVNVILYTSPPLSLARRIGFLSQPLIFSLLFVLVQVETYQVVVLLHLPFRRGSGY